MKYLFLLVLAFPLIELATLIALAGRFGGGPVFLALLAGAGIGVLILRNQQLGALLTLSSVMRNGQQTSLWQLLWPLRYVFAGLLFIFPGVISDVLALLLLLPFKGPKIMAGPIGGDFRADPFGRPPQRDDGTIDGEYTRVDEQPTQLTDRKP